MQTYLTGASASAVGRSVVDTEQICWILCLLMLLLDCLLLKRGQHPLLDVSCAARLQVARRCLCTVSKASGASRQSVGHWRAPIMSACLGGEPCYACRPALHSDCTRLQTHKGRDLDVGAGSGPAEVLIMTCRECKQTMPQPCRLTSCSTSMSGCADRAPMLTVQHCSRRLGLSPASA